eukprot:CAMPEP_0178379218 /NCGR_PEP_ID=MMETSP0689_2-20121128/4827_1 /TAXON_ID=160604 /ORGANISM="Amphidinium massartii, Strain CS-259" /LENGTH=163 /DNA_ID=CAMNT_0019999309 /DNA_START=164 /DNA_END=653 /DNA_ORIENTATION=-
MTHVTGCGVRGGSKRRGRRSQQPRKLRDKHRDDQELAVAEDVGCIGSSSTSGSGFDSSEVATSGTEGSEQRAHADSSHEVDDLHPAPLEEETLHHDLSQLMQTIHQEVACGRSGQPYIAILMAAGAIPDYDAWIGRCDDEVDRFDAMVYTLGRFGLAAEIALA